MELVVDCRETSLIGMLGEKGVFFQSKNLELGDLLIQKEQQPLLMIERKTVRDLVASLKDGRYHNQRQRWKEFLQMYPGCKVAVWIEGDLLACYDIEDSIKSSLINSLLRLQSIHGILVFQVRSTLQFVQSLRFLMEKLEKDPSHLSVAKEDNGRETTPFSLKPFKKTTNVSPEMVWRSTLALVPGVSSTTALEITKVFPTMKSLVLEDDPSIGLSEVMVNGRRLGKKTAQKIIDLLCV